MDHSFVIPAFGAAPHLGRLVESLRAQSGPASDILITTSTPTPELALVAKQLSLPLHINPQRIEIATDWNFALKASRTNFVTIAHQDDHYAPAYVRKLSEALRQYPDALFSFCDYSEHTDRGPRPINMNVRIKRALARRAYGSGGLVADTRMKLRLLSLGNPICCPSVMFNRVELGEFRFPGGLKSNLDWMAWLDLARRPGGFAYVRESLVSKWVHHSSETTAAIANRVREREDRMLFDAFWPRPIAAVLAAIYKLGLRANRI
jgi:hypothetical protein